MLAINEIKRRAIVYTKVEDVFWRDEKLRLADEDLKWAMVYLLTSPHRNIIGFYYLPHAYACVDLNWDLKRWTKALSGLIKLARIKYDEGSNVVLMMNYLKYNKLENPNQVKAAIEKLDSLPGNSCLADFEVVLLKYYKPFMQPLVERLRERLGQPVTVTGEVTGAGTGAEEEIPDADPMEAIPYKEIQALWNRVCFSFPKVVSLSKKRKDKLKARYRRQPRIARLYHFIRPIRSGRP
jgi:hypothetical protein